MMTCGGIEFKTKGRDDQAECELIGPDTFPGKAAGAFQIDPFQMIKVFCKPRIKVGTEWVTKGQTCDQATGAVGGIARAIFDRVFKWLIEKCNVSDIFLLTFVITTLMPLLRIPLLTPP